MSRKQRIIDARNKAIADAKERTRLQKLARLGLPQVLERADFVTSAGKPEVEVEVEVEVEAKIEPEETPVETKPKVSKKKPPKKK